MSKPRSSSEAVAHYKCGFTLIEMSITLVIIGLIIGGVLVGRDLIKAGEIRKTITEMDKVTAAVNTFKLKYNCLAGDCPNAAQFFGAGAQPDQTTNGDGNGSVDAVIGYPETTSGNYAGSERVFFFDHLANAKLLAMQTFDESALNMDLMSPGNGYGKAPIGEGFIVYFAGGPGDSGAITPGGHAFLLGIRGSPYGDRWFNTDIDENGKGLVSAPDAYQIDSKIDDGKPLEGKVRALAPDDGEENLTIYLSSPAAPGSSSCASNATGNPYSNDIADTCALSIKAGF